MEREEIHLRRVEVRAFRRADGLYDIEARMQDTKTHPFGPLGAASRQPGEPIHDLGVTLVVDENLKVHDASAFTNATPFPQCAGATSALAKLKGLSIGTGWLKACRERLAGAQGCTHMLELLGPAATTAYQAMAPVHLGKPGPVDGNGKPKKIDSCWGYASHQPIVLQRWPAFYTGPVASTRPGE